MNDRRSSAFAIAATVLAGIALVGCTPDPQPTPKPQATFASEAEAFAAAEAVYREYIDAFNRVDLADAASFESLREYTAGDYLAGEQESLSELHAERVSRTGDLKVEWFRGTAVSENSQVTARVCNNVGDVNLTDSNGQTLVSPERPTRYAISLTFEKSSNGVYIIASDATRDSQCAPS